MSRYFVSSQTQFTFAAVLGARASFVTAQVWVAGVQRAILGLSAGVTEVQSSPGVWEYAIANKELTVNGTCLIKWFGQDATHTNADTYPVLTYPTIAVVNTGAVLSVEASIDEGATGVSTRDALTLDFDAAVDPDFDQSGIVLRVVGTADTVPLQVYVNPDDASQVIVKPASDLAETTLYELHLETTAFYSLTGTQLAAAFDLRFTTGADDFKTVQQVTSEGVVERAAPIVLAGTAASTTSPLTSSSPANNAFNWLGTQLLLTMSEDLDETVAPTVTLVITPVFGLNELYWVSGSLWGQETEPTLPVVSGTVVSGSTVLVTLDSTIGNAILTVTVSGLKSASGVTLADAVLTVTTGLYPYRVGVPEVRNLVRQYILPDITDRLIAEMITNIGLFWYSRISDKAAPSQRRAILYEAAIQLMDDWWAARGAGGGESKTLGAFSVSFGSGGAAFTSGPYGRLVKKLADAEHDLVAFFCGPQVAVKSADNPLEHKNYRIRGWRDPIANRPDLDENLTGSRLDKLPDQPSNPGNGNNLDR